MMHDRKTGVAAFLLGVLFWACAGTLPAEERNPAQSAVATNMMVSVENKSRDTKSVYSLVLAVWRDTKTGELRSATLVPSRPPLLASK